MEKKIISSLAYEELQLLAIYNLNNAAGTRQGLIEVLEDMRRVIDPEIPEDVDLLGRTDVALSHLREMSDAEFEILDLSVDFPE